MHYPLTEEMFLSLELSKPIDREFTRAFVQAVNVWYEKGKAAMRSSFFMTAEILKTVYKRLYNEKPEGEADALFFDIFVEL